VWHYLWRHGSRNLLERVGRMMNILLILWSLSFLITIGLLVAHAMLDMNEKRSRFVKGGLLVALPTWGISMVLYWMSGT
jgi:hypothetical protein